MRVTGGELRGRRLRVPPGAQVRPTQDAVREALFSMLAMRVPGCAFLDLFGGSGSVGIEAWSRGAAQVTWVESNRSTFRVLADNVRTLCGEEGTQMVEDDALRWLKRGSECAMDIVYADPPYGDAERDDGVEALLDALARGNWMAPDGLFVVEQRAGTPMPKARGWSRIKDRRYGHTRLTLFAYTGTTIPTDEPARAETRED